MFRKHLLLCTVTVLSVLYTTFDMVANDDDRRGVGPITEGCRYMVAFPQVWADTTESPFQQAPMLLLISSQTRTKVRVRSAAASNDRPRYDKEYTVVANGVLRVPISIEYMNELSEKKTGSGIAVEASSPVSVSTYQQWNGNGELARHLPIDGWGREYYTMNFYQDRYGTAESGYNHRPGQIMIVSGFDSTVVTYTPTVDTEGGVKKGSTATVTLQRGECYLIKAKIQDSLHQKWSSDLSGTLIRSTIPIGVVSGHTKVGILRNPDVVTGFGGTSTAHFLRNNVHDVMLPTELAGTSFVTVPCRYPGTRVTGKTKPNLGVEDDRGDVIRVVALEDGTVVKSKSPDGTTLLTRMTLNKGMTEIVPAVEEPTFWESNKPILMAQYGKSYAKDPSIGGAQKEGESTLGHPSVDAGMPMLQVVPSVDRFVENGVFYAPEGMDNFLNIVFKADEITKIKFDGRALNRDFGGATRYIAGTPHACLSVPIGAGGHWIESVEPNVRWSAWTYGSLDGRMQGRSYGTSVAVDLSIPCDDSLLFTDKNVCGDVEGNGLVLIHYSISCSSVFGVYPTDVSNYLFEHDTLTEPGCRSVRYTLKVLDKNFAATAKVRLLARSGKYLERTYLYTPAQIESTPKNVDFGANSVYLPITKSVTINNPDGKESVAISKLSFLRRSDVFSCKPDSAIVLAPGDSASVEITAMAKDGQIVDTLVADLLCRSVKLLPVRAYGIPLDVHEEQRDGQTLTIDPTPSNESVDITFAIQHPGTLSIYTLDGNSVFTQHINDQTKGLHIDLSHLSSGVYIVTLSTQQGTVSKPLYRM